MRFLCVHRSLRPGDGESRRVLVHEPTVTQVGRKVRFFFVLHDDTTI